MQHFVNEHFFFAVRSYMWRRNTGSCSEHRLTLPAWLDSCKLNLMQLDHHRYLFVSCPSAMHIFGIDICACLPYFSLFFQTHPTQDCFMSSVDLHNHYSYQVMQLYPILLFQLVGAMVDKWIYRFVSFLSVHDNICLFFIQTRKISLKYMRPCTKQSCILLFLSHCPCLEVIQN